MNLFYKNIAHEMKIQKYKKALKNYSTDKDFIYF